MKWTIAAAAICVVFTFLRVSPVDCHSKYSEAMNKHGPPPKHLKTSEDKPFRMHKLNVLWEKAQKRLSEAKLKSLYVDLKVQDKDELTWKKLKSAGQDKEGLKEAELKKTLKGILEKYDLADHWKPYQDETPDHINEAKANRVFKDKKLNKLWLKIEQSGLDQLELKTLKEEFQHHQDKIDQFYETLDTFGSRSKRQNELENSLEQFLRDTEESDAKRDVADGTPHAQLKSSHRDLKESFDQLNARARKLVELKEFDEEKVQQLWQLAQKGDFTPAELESLREELQHYEHRLRKLNHFRSELDLKKQAGAATDKSTDVHPDELKTLQQRIKQYDYKVNKVHADLESRILQRRLEL
ncbi:alpha-2-macroglobulin receptor-associated protein-like [Ornithodoros turicata]|uniref:alpha-2-macroglobulin receptor-associated protein-like n=1 Tax=Ornithodoros turicata TaxID=34597 RepID=UPI003139354C